MAKRLDKVFKNLVALNKQTNKQTNKRALCKNIQRLEVQFTRTSDPYARKWGGWYLISGRSGDCL